MSFCEYLNTQDKDTYLCISECEYQNNLLYFDYISSITCIYIEAPDFIVRKTNGVQQPSQSKFKKFIDGVIRNIRKLIQKIKDTFASMLGKSKKLENSTEKTDLAIDLIKSDQEIDRQLETGTQIISDIVSGKEQNPKSRVDSFIDNGVDIVKRFAVPAIVAGVGYRQFVKYNEKKALESKEARLQNARNISEKAVGDSVKEPLIAKVFNKMIGYVNAGIHIVNNYNTTFMQLNNE